jgi:hypothetical protein
MSIQLAISPELELRLKLEAARRNQPAEELALRLLDQHLPPVIPSKAISLLDRWADEDEATTDMECAANAAVLMVLDHDRPSDRKLFINLRGEAS